MNMCCVLQMFPASYQLLGPFTESELRAELRSGRISMSDLLFAPDRSIRWRRMYEVKELLLEALLPSSDELGQFEKEARERIENIDPQTGKTMFPTKSLVSSKKKEWYLQAEGAEFGPFNHLEVGRILESKKLNGKIFAWKNGLSNWMEAHSLEQVLAGLSIAERTSKYVIEKGFNRRIHVRASMIATVSVTVKGRTSVGLCLDISAGGLQVGKWDVLVQENGKYTLLITPLATSGCPPFSVRSQVTWVGHRSQLTGFRFLDFETPEDQEYLTDYLKKSQPGI
jgi:hypothetical protein